jgi:hypothetical protein
MSYAVITKLFLKRVKTNVPNFSFFAILEPESYCPPNPPAGAHLLPKSYMLGAATAGFIYYYYYLF